MGTRLPTFAVVVDLQDHPHAYGDKLLFPCFPLYLQGSSPRVWGQVILEESYVEDFRIIPTRMGTRGGLKLNPVKKVGSSPRVWGQELLNCFIEK